MKRSLLFVVLISLACGSCALNPSARGTPFGPNDYAFMSAQPYPQETALAQKRFQNFLRRANAKGRLTLAQTPFVAVRAYQLTANEVPGLTWRMALGRVPMTYYGSDLLQNPGSVPVAFLLIFDQRTGRLAAPDGVLVVGSPVKGTIGQFGGVRAVYAGGGWWWFWRPFAGLRRLAANRLFRLGINCFFNDSKEMPILASNSHI
jgi:hypothetical protein